MSNRLYEKRKEKYYTEDIEKITSKELILKLYTSCESLFILSGLDYTTVHAKKFLNEIANTTNEYLKDSKEVHIKTFITHTKGRPYLFELIRLNKKDILHDKKFSNTFVNTLEESLNKLGYSYDTNFTKEDIIKLLMIIIDLRKPDANIKLSLNDEEIYQKPKEKTRK